MKTLFLTLLLATLCATGYGQTIKSLGYNTTNGEVVYTGTNLLTFTNNFQVFGYIYPEEIIISGTNGIIFDEADAAATTRTNLGIPLPALTNTNAQNLLDALGVTGGDALVQGIQVDRAKVLWDGADDDWGFQAVDGSWKTQAVFTTTNAPTNTNAAIWIAVEIGTNTYKLPLFQ